MDELEKRVEELEVRVDKIANLEADDPHAKYIPCNLHHMRHKALDRKSVKHDEAIRYNWSAIKELRQEVAELRLAVLRLASNEAIHVLLK